MRRPLTLLAFTTTFALALLSAPTPAIATDDVGKTGVATRVELLTPSADTYLQYHGRLILLVDGINSEEYRWGGTSCGSRTMSEANLRALNIAVRTGASVTPRFQAGQGTARCLVGFSIE